MINGYEEKKFTITPEQFVLVLKEVNSSKYTFGFDHEEALDGNIEISIIGKVDELATLSLPAPNATPDPVVEDDDAEEDETSVSVSDVKDIVIGGAVGATKIGFKTVGGVAEVAATAGGRAALAGSNTVVKTARAVADRITEDKEWAEAKANATAAYTLGKRYGKKAFGWLGKAIKDAAN